MKTLWEKIDRAAEIVIEIGKLEAEYKKLASDIKLAALDRPGEHKPLEDEEREGRQWLAVGSDIKVPVLLTSDALMQSFRKGSAEHTQIAGMAGNHFPRFYADPQKFEIVEEDGKMFRRLAGELLGAEAGAKFVQACLSRDKKGVPKSQIKIDWSRAEKVEVAA